jgi:hypothetical protein
LLKLELTKRKSLHLLGVFKNIFTITSEHTRKGIFFVRNPLKMSMKAKSILAIALVVIMLVSVFAWLSAETQSRPNIIEIGSNGTIASPSPTNQQTSHGTATPSTPSHSEQWNPIKILSEIVNPTPKPAGLIESNLNISTQVWKTIAANAWQFFQPDIGLDRTTGLPRSSLSFPYFTDWDLGVYVQAIIDANKTGLIGNEGDWGSNARIEKVLTFIETRELNNASYPFWFYQSSDGQNYHAASDLSTNNVDSADTGRLLVALNNLKSFNFSLASRINNFVYNSFHNRSDYSVLLPSIKGESMVSTSVYSYFAVAGYESFWSSELTGAANSVLNNILSVNKTTNGLYGVSLPKATISCDPLLCSVFDLPDNPNLIELSKQVYLAHEAKYNATGQYVAFSEGITSTNFIYEWVVLPNGDTWKIMNAGETSYVEMNPIIYTKVSLSFLALYNTAFARNMTIYLERSLPDSTNGYYAGADFNVDIFNANLVLTIDSNSNGMILSASRYAIQNLK